MRNFLKERKGKLDILKNLRSKNYSYKKKEVNEFLFSQCSRCKKTFPLKEKEESFVCPHCDEYFSMPAGERAKRILDEGYEKIELKAVVKNPLDFEGYEEKADKVRKKTGLSDALLCFRGRIENIPILLVVMDNRFFMGSMGSSVGENIAYIFELALEQSLPVVIFCASGGARMQEGMYSLMQMAKTAAAVKRHGNAGLLYISCLTNPTTGGVTASFASLGDIILSEPQALIGFAGPRVIEQTIGKSLPEGFQKAEFLLEKGFLDAIVPRDEMRKTLSFLLKVHGGREERA